MWCTLICDRKVRARTQMTSRIWRWCIFVTLPENQTTPWLIAECGDWSCFMVLLRCIDIKCLAGHAVHYEFQNSIFGHRRGLAMFNLSLCTLLWCVFKYSIDANKINLNIEMMSRNQFEPLKAALLRTNLFKHSNDAKTSVLAFERCPRIN